MNRAYQRFAASVFIVGILVAIAGPALLHMIALQTWDVILPPPNPKLTDAELIFVRNSVVHYLSCFPVTLGICLALVAVPNWIRARRIQTTSL